MKTEMHFKSMCSIKSNLLLQNVSIMNAILYGNVINFR